MERRSFFSFFLAPNLSSLPPPPPFAALGEALLIMVETVLLLLLWSLPQSLPQDQEQDLLPCCCLLEGLDLGGRGLPCTSSADLRLGRVNAAGGDTEEEATEDPRETMEEEDGEGEGCGEGGETEMTGGTTAEQPLPLTAEAEDRFPVLLLSLRWRCATLLVRRAFFLARRISWLARASATDLAWRRRGMERT